MSPVAVECEPAGQSVHAADPLRVLYFPDSHNVHPAKPLLPVLPASQLHTSGDVAASCSEFFPATHLVHAALPVPVLYVPCPQGVHAPVNPAAQLHSGMCALHAATKPGYSPG